MGDGHESAQELASNTTEYNNKFVQSLLAYAFVASREPGPSLSTLQADATEQGSAERNAN